MAVPSVGATWSSSGITRSDRLLAVADVAVGDHDGLGAARWCPRCRSASPGRPGSPAARSRSNGPGSRSASAWPSSSSACQPSAWARPAGPRRRAVARRRRRATIARSCGSRSRTESQHGQELPLDDDHGRRAVADDVRGLLGGDRGVDEHRDAAGVHHRVVGDRRLRAVARPDRRELAGPQARSRPGRAPRPAPCSCTCR